MIIGTLKEILKKDFIFELIEKAPLIILLLDKKANIIYFNKYFENLTGYNLNELIGKEYFSIFIPINIRDKIKEVFNSRLKNLPEYEKYQNEIITKDRKVKIIDWYNFNVYKDGQLNFVLSLGVDVTEEIKKKEELKILNIAINQVKNGVIITDEKGIIKYANPYMEELTGYKVDELIGKNPRVFKSNYYPKEVYEELWRIISNGESWEGYFYNKRKDGTLYWEKTTITPIKYDDKIIGYIGIKEDCTETQNLIKSLDDLSDELENIVEKRTEELKKTVEELSKEKEARRKAEKLLIRSSKMEAIGSFTSGIVHDIKNIVNAIKMYNELLMLEPANDNIKNYSKEIEKGTEKIFEYLNSILKFGKEESDEKTIVDIDLFMKDILNFISNTIPKNIILKRIFARENLKAKINKNEIEQVIVNIIVNAKEAIGTKNGLIAIEIDKTNLVKEKALELNLKEGDYIVIKILNNGPQIPPEIMDKIFDPFFTTKDTGTGLGLSFSLDIINRHKGNIIVDSSIETTSFTIYLPEYKD